MESHSSNPLPCPERLKTLAFNVQDSKRNNLFHQFVLDNSDPYILISGNYISDVLRSMSDDSVNALNDDGYSALHLAVLKNNLLMVNKLLSCLRNIDINTRCGSCIEENTALHLAAELGHLSIVQELLHKGASVNIQNMNGKTALYFAAQSGDLDVMKLLVSNGADVDPVGARQLPLHYVARSGNLGAVKFLVSSGADVNSEHRFGSTPLHNAAQSRNLEIVEFLVNNGAHVNAKYSNYSTPLHYAACSGSLEIVAFLVDKGADLHATDRFGSTALHSAMYEDHLEIGAFLVHHGANLKTVYSNGKTLLQEAVRNGSANFVKMFIDNGANVNARDVCDALFCAIELGHTDIVKLLLVKLADVNTINDDTTSLSYAIKFLHAEIIKLILAGANVNTSNETLLFSLIKSAYLHIVKLFLAEEGDVNAIELGDADIVKLILESGAYVTVDENGDTILQTTCDHPDITDMLLINGSDVNAKNELYQTPTSCFSK